LLNFDQMRYGGGETGIRTLGTLAGSTVFETATFDHSATSPRRGLCSVDLERVRANRNPLFTTEVTLSWVPPLMLGICTGTPYLLPKPAT
jgi:hypothetical protein